MADSTAAVSSRAASARGVLMGGLSAAANASLVAVRDHVENAAAYHSGCSCQHMIRSAHASPCCLHIAAAQVLYFGGTLVSHGSMTVSKKQVCACDYLKMSADMLMTSFRWCVASILSGGRLSLIRHVQQSGWARILGFELLHGRCPHWTRECGTRFQTAR